MDHLDDPPDAVLFENIPFFEPNLSLYDGLGLADFPERMQATQQAHFLQRFTASFIQGWLYFGLLREIFGPSAHLEHFIRPAPSESRCGTEMVVSTAMLDHYIDLMLESWASQSNVVARVLNMDTTPMKLMHKACRFVNEQCNNLDYMVGLHDAHLPAILFSIHLLLERLKGVEYFGAAQRDRHVDIGWQCPRSLEFVRDHMLRQTGAWCPHQINYLFKNCSYAGLAYIAQLKRHVGPWFDHNRCRTQLRCSGYNIEDDTFRGKHTPECQGCSHVDAPLNDMYAILEDGYIPLLRCQRTRAATDTIRLSYSKIDRSSRYVAVSHVWSDGLGTPSKNSVPRCQLTRLIDSALHAAQYEPVQKMFGAPSLRKDETSVDNDDILIWVDVYCVPASSRDKRLAALKQKAIELMLPTYSLADFTLVLDHELRQLKTLSSDPFEAAVDVDFLARLIVCGWRSRCWTFSERHLSQRLMIQCAGSFVAFDDTDRFSSPETSLIEEFKAIGDPFLAYSPQTYRRETGILFPSVRGLPTVPKFGNLWNAFQSKTTSKPLDALFVFASIMRLSAKQIRHYSPANQMRAILRATIDNEGSLPVGLFLSQAPRISEEDAGELDRWIPALPGDGEVTNEDNSHAPTVWSGDGFLLNVRRGYSRVFGIRIPLLTTRRFRTYVEDELIEIDLSLSPSETGPLTSALINPLIVFQWPERHKACRGSGACFLPVSQSMMAYSILERFSSEVKWHCHILFRKVHETPEDNVLISDDSPPLIESKYETRPAHIHCDWKEWKVPERFIGRGESGMRFWAVCNVWLFLGVVLPSLTHNFVPKDGSTAIIWYIMVFVWFGITITLNINLEGLLHRARWLLMLQTYHASYNPDERWYTRLVKQLDDTPGQSRWDVFMLKTYAYWARLFTTIWDILRISLSRLVMVLPSLWRQRKRIQLDEDVSLVSRDA